MTYPYPFQAGYTKGGIATAPSPAPTINVLNIADGSLLVTGGAPTAHAAMPGLNTFTYNGAPGLNLVGLFHTADTSVDQQDLSSYSPDYLQIAATNIAAILADYARRAGDYSVLVLGDKMDLVDAPNATALLAIQAGLAQTGADEDTLKTLSDQLDLMPTLGEGSQECIVHIETPAHAPLSGVIVTITSDDLGLHPIRRGITNALGNVTFWLDPGTYYVWKSKDGCEDLAPDPETMVVAA